MFNPACFAAPTPGHNGTAVFPYIKGQPYWGLDATLSKNFAIGKQGTEAAVPHQRLQPAQPPDPVPRWRPQPDAALHERRDGQHRLREARDVDSGWQGSAEQVRTPDRPARPEVHLLGGRSPFGWSGRCPRAAPASSFEAASPLGVSSNGRASLPRVVRHCRRPAREPPVGSARARRPGRGFEASSRPAPVRRRGRAGRAGPRGRRAGRGHPLVPPGRRDAAEVGRGLVVPRDPPLRPRPLRGGTGRLFPGPRPQARPGSGSSPARALRVPNREPRDLTAGPGPVDGGGLEEQRRDASGGLVSPVHPPDPWRPVRAGAPADDTALPLRAGEPQVGPCRRPHAPADGDLP